MKAFRSIPLFVFSAFSTFVSAQAPEPPASIVMEYRTADGRLIPSLGGLKTGQTVIATVKAYDRFGNRIKDCTPRIQPIQGVSGNQLIVDPLGDGTFNITGGQGFGSAELQASCAQFPDFYSKEFVAVSRDLQPSAAQRQALSGQPAPQSPPVDPSVSGSDAAVGTAIAVGAVAAGVGLAAVIAAAAAAGGSDDNCPSFSECCPGGGGSGGCGAPADCNCPSGTTNQGICNSAGCGAFIGIGNRSCTCN